MISKKELIFSFQSTSRSIKSSFRIIWQSKFQVIVIKVIVSKKDFKFDLINIIF